MPLSRSRDYLSIGEVLDSLQGEFPDITISKIRFLETEGLITPKRTGSGYRMFYEDDVRRLRYILALQRDHFLPLKVIRERLPEIEANGGAAMQAPSIPAAPAAAPPAGVLPTEGREDGRTDLTGIQMKRAELLKAAGLSDKELAGLEEYGIVAASESGNYDEAALIVARAAKRFFEFGVEPRHLKMYRQFAEREVAFFEQIVSPVTRRHDPTAQKEAMKSVRELAGLARQMRDATLRTSLKELL